MIVLPNRDSLTQGTLFSYAVAEDYPDDHNYGLVITARCDIAQEKADKFNYLPVVPYNVWLQKDGLKLLAARECNSRLGRISSTLKDCGEDEEILEYQSPIEVINALLPSSTKKEKDRKNACLESADAITQIISLRSALPESSPELFELIGKKALQAFFKEIATHRLLGYYFLPQVCRSLGKNGYVVLLREIHHLPYQVAQALPRGVSSIQQFGEMKSQATGLRINPGETAMPVGNLESPYIEHLMQAFTNLFSRIGLPDTNVKEAYRACILPYE